MSEWYVKASDLYKHEKEVCQKQQCEKCPFSTPRRMCEWKIFLNGLPRYYADMVRGEE